MKNILISRLEQIGVLEESRLELFYPEVRDRDDVAVLRDPVTEVIILSKVAVSVEYYQAKVESDTLRIRNKDTYISRLDDNLRRKVNFSSYIKNKIWLDFGCGLGCMLDQMEGMAKEAIGLEPNQDRAQFVAQKGHKVVASMDDIEDQSLDVITLFHVLEHLVDIDEIFLQIRRCLKDNGVLIVEVPHARDILFTTFDCDDFKKFTFWSEHLVLHTRNSLHQFLNFFKFRDIQIQGIQRYPLSNHMYWISKGLPGGHEVWGFLDNELVEMGYQMSLQKIDRSDTLVAVCRK